MTKNQRIRCLNSPFAPQRATLFGILMTFLNEKTAGWRLEYWSGMVSQARFDKSLWRSIEMLLLLWTSGPSWLRLPIPTSILCPNPARWRTWPAAACRGCWTRWSRTACHCRCWLPGRWREDWLWAGRGRSKGGEGRDVGGGQRRRWRTCWVRDERRLLQQIQVRVERLLQQGGWRQS